MTTEKEKRPNRLLDSVVDRFPEKISRQIEKELEEREFSFKYLKKFSNWHHRAAQMIAAGVKVKEVALKLGKTPERLYWLRTNEPAFNELVDFYKDRQTVMVLDLTDQLAELSELAADELLYRLEHDPGSFTNKELFELLRLSADRTGHGPTQKVEGEFSAHGVAKVMLEKLDRIRGDVIDADSSEVQAASVMTARELTYEQVDQE